VDRFFEKLSNGSMFHGPGVGGFSLILFLQRSYIWTRVVKFVWPFVIVISAIRAIIMIVQLQRG